jgi:DNA-binding NtrC family response regulator
LVAPETEAIPETTDEDAVSPVTPERSISRILWVTDNPKRVAYEIAKLRDDGVSVEIRESTSTAKDALSKSHFDAIISNMDRLEDGHENQEAGIDLIKAVRETDKQIPVYIYTVEYKAQAFQEKVKEADGTGITSSPSKMFDMIYHSDKSRYTYGDR